MFDLVGDYTERQHLDPCDGLIPCGTIGHRNRQLRNGRWKAAISFSIDFDSELHSIRIAAGDKPQPQRRLVRRSAIFFMERVIVLNLSPN